MDKKNFLSFISLSVCGLSVMFIVKLVEVNKTGKTFDFWGQPIAYSPELLLLAILGLVIGAAVFIKFRS